MELSQTGIDLIKSFEGFKASAYYDSAKVLTIGYGTTNSVKAYTGFTITTGSTVTKAQAETLLKKAVDGKFGPNVNKYNSTYSWTQSEYDALCSFAYNIGSIDGLTANGTRSRSEIASKMLEYNKSGGKVLAGLTARRQKEQALFLSGSTSTTATSSSTTSSSEFKVKILATTLNYRAGAGTKYEVKGTVKKGEVYTITKTSGNWGYLKSGAGWISLNSKYVSKI